MAADILLIVKGILIFKCMRGPVPGAWIELYVLIDVSKSFENVDYLLKLYTNSILLCTVMYTEINKYS